MPFPQHAQVIELLNQGFDTYNMGSELGPAVEQLTASNPTSEPGFRSLEMGQGTWEVFYAPHIASMSSVLRTKFQPVGTADCWEWCVCGQGGDATTMNLPQIRYHLEGNRISSSVKFENPVLGTGWLSASGSMAMKDAGAVQVGASASRGPPCHPSSYPAPLLTHMHRWPLTSFGWTWGTSCGGQRPVGRQHQRSTRRFGRWGGPPSSPRFPTFRCYISTRFVCVCVLGGVPGCRLHRLATAA